MIQAPLWGIDLGGTKIEGVIMNPNKPGEALYRLRRETGASHGYHHIVTQIAGVISDLQQSSGFEKPSKIGIGTPGAVEPITGTLKNSNTLCLNGSPLRDDLSELLNCEVSMANDANCFALAEAVYGAGKGSEVALGLIIGTGVGSGIVVREKIINGLHGIAGEWGHNPLRSESTSCYCGRTGCIEGAIAGPSLERYYRDQGGEAIRLPEISRKASEGDPLAIRTLDRLREKFAEAIAPVINILDPDVIIIGGGVGNVPLLYAEPTKQAILKHLFNHEIKTRIVPPLLGDSAGVFGAALLAA